MSSSLVQPQRGVPQQTLHRLQQVEGSPEQQQQQQQQQSPSHGRPHPRNARLFQGWPWIALATTSLFLSNGYTSDAALACNSNAFCEERLRPGSVCLDESKTCSNPYQRGCLATRLPDDVRFQNRVCNSNDNNTTVGVADGNDQDATPGLCQQPDYFVYDEIRIHNGNWESSIFLSWIMQIVLMEIVHVPVTIGLGPDTSAGSFYNERNTLEYSTTAYPFEAIKEATRVGDCRQSSSECTHVLPEVWNGQIAEWTKALDTGDIDPVEGNGQVGKGSWYVPYFTATRDNSLVNFYGLRGEYNRHKLADAFRRPTTWKEYCEDVSLTNCTTLRNVNSLADVVAFRYPTPDEESLYYAGPGNYLGHFRLTDANNCTLNPTTCAGHIIGPPCSWSTNVDSQLYWNGITLIPDGPVQPNGGYDYGQMLQIWRAANATQSDVMFWWWRPDALIEEFHGTNAQFQQVLLPEATDTCSRARVDTEARCSLDIMERRGSPEGACDQEAHALQKVFARSLRERTLDESTTTLASRSPGYSILQSLKITDLEINHMIRTWLATNVDRYGNDAREAVCDWVLDHLADLIDTVPEGYPRILSQQSSFGVGYLYAAQAVALFTALVVLCATGLTVRYRKTQVFVYTQVYLCWLILFGFLSVSLGSMVTAMEPDQATCSSRAWLVTLGYTIEIGTKEKCRFFKDCVVQ
jgi:hypothetical protein